MNCQNCSTEYPPSSRFCRNCGVPLGEPSVTIQDALVRAVAKAYRWAQGLIIFLAVFAVSYLLLQVSQLSTLESVCLFIGIAFVSVILPLVWLKWQASAYEALGFMGSGVRSYGGVVSCWFLPFVNLFRPFQLTREMWVRSSSGNRVNKPIAGMPWLVVAWWIACLSPLAWFFSEYFSRNMRTVIVVYSPFISAVLAIIVVIKIQDFQLAQTGKPERLVRMSGVALKSVAGIGVLVAVFWFGSVIREKTIVFGPEDSIKALAKAYNNHDRVTFHRYCDTASILRQAEIRSKFAALTGQVAEPFLHGDAAPLLGLAAIGSSSSANDIAQEGDDEDEDAIDTEKLIVGQNGLPSFVLPILGWFMHLDAPGSPMVKFGRATGLSGVNYIDQMQSLRSDLSLGFRGINKVTLNGEDASVQLRYDISRKGRLYNDTYIARMQHVENHWRAIDFCRISASLANNELL